jgi:hypothetical protein
MRVNIGWRVTLVVDAVGCRSMAADWTDLELEYSAGGEPIVRGRLPGHPEWKVTATFAHQGDQLVVASCSIAPAGDLPLGGLTARQVRRATLGDLTRRVSVGLVGRILGALAPDATRPPDDDQTQPRPGRAGRDDHFYAVWAARYTERAAYTNRPIAELAEAHDRPPTRIREYIAEARRRGLLTATRPGRSGGQLTDKARALLEHPADE